MMLLIKGKMIWGKSSRKIRQITRPFDADYRMKWRSLHCHLVQIVTWGIGY